MKTIKINSARCNFTFITDLHLSAIPPGRRGDNYQAAVLKKISFVRELTESLGGVGLCGGDVFHSKSPRGASNTLDLIASTAREFNQFPYGCMFGAIGNHDLSEDNIGSLPHQPLGLLIAAGVYHDLSVEPIIFTNENGTVKVLVEAFPYEHKGTLERILNASPRPAGVDYRIGLVHAYGKPGDEGNLYGEQIIGYNQVAQSDYDFLLWGHDHSRVDTQTVGNVTHVRFGSLARAAYSMDEVDRPVSCAVISFAEDGIRFKEKQIPVVPLNIAFTAANKTVQDVTKSGDLKAFFDLMDEQVGDVTILDPKTLVKEKCPVDEPELLNLVYDLCEIW